jgi:hypothetical protein
MVGQGDVVENYVRDAYQIINLLLKVPADPCNISLRTQLFPSGWRKKVTLFFDLLRKEAEKVIKTRILEESLHRTFGVLVLNFCNGRYEIISASCLVNRCLNDSVKNLDERKIQAVQSIQSHLYEGMIMLSN